MDFGGAIMERSMILAAGADDEIAPTARAAGIVDDDAVRRIEGEGWIVDMRTSGRPAEGRESIIGSE